MLPSWCQQAGSDGADVPLAGAGEDPAGVL
jgi:hypothetical protein